jgi:hypothetical protein
MQIWWRVDPLQEKDLDRNNEISDSEHRLGKHVPTGKNTATM